MAMEETIGKFTEQFSWEPVVENEPQLDSYKHFVVCGMGGSQLAPMLLRSWLHEGAIVLHRDYGLPALSPEFETNALIILSSYSGTTEETLDSARLAMEKKLPTVAVSTGGKLIEFAKEHGLPYVQIPELGLQPRLATGFSLLAIARLMKASDLVARIQKTGRALDLHARKAEGLKLAEALRGNTPLIYSSKQNEPIAYVWKIKLNETSKIPAFYNVFPELCHNEINGMDPADATRPLTAGMHVLMLEDESDDPRNRKRMQVASEIFKERGIAVSHIALSGEPMQKAFDQSVLADWVSYALADYYRVPAEETPLIAEFKRRIAS